MRNMRLVLPILVVFCFVPVCRAEQYDNPRFAEWAKFNIGSSQTLERVTGEGDRQVITEEVRTLTEKNADYVVVEKKSTMSAHGQSLPPGSPHTEKFYAKLDKDPQEKPAGEEKIDAAGKTYDCKVFTITTPSPIPGRPDTTIKMWVCPDVPGGIVKMDSSTPNGSFTWILKSSETK